MSRSLLIVTNGMTGMRLASSELANRLSDFGYDVHIASPETNISAVSDAGITLHPLELENFYSKSVRFSKDIPKSINAFLKRKQRSIAAMASFNLEAYRLLLKKLQPDLVLIHQEMHAHVLSTWEERLPTLLMSPFFQSRQSTGVPPIQSLTDIDDSRNAKKAWNKHRRNRLKRDLAMWIKYAGVTKSSVIKAYVRRIDSAGIKLDPASWPPPFVIDGIPTLYLVSEALEFPHQKPDSNYYVGPMIHEAGPLPAPIASAIEAARIKGNKICYTVNTTMGNNKSTLDPTIASVFENHPEWTLIASHSGKAASKELPELDNVHYFDWVPQNTLLPLVDCCIHHGGTHTVHECAYHGVPSVIYGRQYNDLAGNTARALYAGIAIRVSETDDTGAMDSAIQRALTEDLLQHSVRKASEKMRNPAERNLLFEVIEELLEDDK